MTTTTPAAVDLVGTGRTATSTASVRTRPEPAGPLASTRAYAWRGLLRIKHVPEQAAHVIAIPIVFTVIFTYLFGGALAGSPGQYLRFLLPGTLVMAVLLITMDTGVGLNVGMSTGVFDRFRSMPGWRAAPLVGGLLGDAARYLIASGIVVTLGLVLGFRPGGGIAGLLGAVGLVVLFALGLSWLWMVFGLIARTPEAVVSIGIVVVFPLTMASNIFVEPRTMPGWLRAFVHANPVSHVATAARGLMNGTATVGEVGWVVLASAVLMAVFAPLAIHLYRNKN